jgi:hypothetical protein
MAIWYKIVHWWYRMLLNYRIRKMIKFEKREKTKKELRTAFVTHPGSRKIMETYFYDIFTFNEKESLYWNQINFLEIVREKELWDILKKVMEE